MAKTANATPKTSDNLFSDLPIAARPRPAGQAKLGVKTALKL
jgi:hypothetical protein